MKPVAKPLSFCLSALFLAGCADLALEADRVPTTLEITPDGGLLVEDQPMQLELLVRDQEGREMSLPSWAPPVWRSSDESVVEISQDGMASPMSGGEVTIYARVGELGTRVSFRINPSPVVLTAPVIYLTQAAQSRGGAVSLIAERPALIRVFMIGDQTSFYGPAVRVTLFQQGEEVFNEVLTATTEHTPSEVDQGDLDASVNGIIPGSVIQPGVTMVVELDPEGLVPLGPGSRTRYPLEGSSLLGVVEPQLFRQIIVPTISTQSQDQGVNEWTDGLNPESPQVRLARTLMPVGPMELQVHDTYTTSADLGTGSGFSAWIQEMSALYRQEGRPGYYYGVADVLGAAYGGLGYVGYPVSVGLPSANIYAHELGHNMNLWHAPCGGAGGPDPNFPYPNGRIGVWGYDIHEHQLRDPNAYVDVMGYCSPDWISDYHFGRATQHRLDGDGGVILDGSGSAGDAGDRGEMLVVWGLVGDGELRLDPSFVVDAPPTPSPTAGPYRVEGIGTDGGTKFSLSFAPTPLEFGGGGFVYMVPWEADWADSLDRMVLTGPEGEYTLTRSGTPPLAVATDPSTGRIRAIIRDWDGGPLPGEATANVTITRGIPGR